MRPGWLLGQLAAGLMVTMPSFAEACTCQDQRIGSGGAALTSAEQSKARLEKAIVVSKGRVISVKAGRDVVWPQGARLGGNVTSMTGTTSRVISAEFETTESVKGGVIGRIVLLSGPGFGECGIGGVLFGAALSDLDISFELTAIEAVPGSYSVDMCGYMDVDAPKSPLTGGR